MITRRTVKVIITLALLLVLTVSYINYSDYASALKREGAYTVSFTGLAYISGGTVVASITTLDPRYVPSPDIPSFTEWLFAGWGSDVESAQVNSSGVTVFTVRIYLSMTTVDGVMRELVDRSFDAQLTTYVASVSWDTECGPYVADDESPLKFHAKVFIDGELKTEKVDYLMLPEEGMSEAD